MVHAVQDVDVLGSLVTALGLSGCKSFYAHSFQHNYIGSAAAHDGPEKS